MQGCLLGGAVLLRYPMRAPVVLLVREMPDPRSHHTDLHAHPHIYYSTVVSTKEQFSFGIYSEINDMMCLEEKKWAGSVLFDVLMPPTQGTCSLYRKKRGDQYRINLFEDTKHV